MTEIDWKNPDYNPIYRERVLRYERVKDNRSALPALKEYYKNNIPEFINDWGNTYDPRKIARGESPIVPFILFPRQREFIEWMLDMWRTGRRGLAEKSRDVGFTWLAASTIASLFLFYENFAAGLGSRKEDLVDKAGDPDSIFWKIRKFIELLPPEFKPEEYTDDGFKKYSQHLLIVNPANGSVIKGEAGDEIGRGGRTSLYVVDEAAFLARPLLSEASLSATTDCRIDISTVNGPGNAFYTNRHSLPPEQVFVFDWTEDPRKRLNPTLPEDQEPWYLKKKAEMDPTVFASEVLRDYSAAIANTYIPTKLIIDAEQTLKSKIHQADDIPWLIGIDAAHAGNDEAVISRRKGRITLPFITRKKVTGPMLAGLAQEEARRLLHDAPVGLISVELDGPGVSCYDQLKLGPFAKIVVGVHTGAKLKNGRDFNLRAWLHRQAKEYLEEGISHLPKDPVFRMQGSSLLHTYRGGLLLIESKDEYKARFARGRSKSDRLAGPSPDRWDSWVLTFVPPKAKPMAQESSEIWMPFDSVMGY